MTRILDQPQTTSALAGSVVHDDVTVATGLLVDADFGTNAGISTNRHVRPVGFVVTGIPRAVISALSADDSAAEVRTLRDRIIAYGFSKQEIARAVGVDRRSLSGYSSGEIRPARERLELLRILADLADAVAVERPGRVRDLLLSRRGRLSLVDQLVTTGRSILATWRVWVARSEAIVSVTPRVLQAEPLWAAAARALSEGRLTIPPRGHTVRPESTYEMDLEEATAFAEPSYESRRRGYR
jgi:transcriptional regulator with XRE-family HTH domain